jgi:hypothetical protein
METYKWDMILEILYKYKEKAFTAGRLRDLTHLNRGYVSKYLSIWKAQGIVSYDNGMWKIDDTVKANKLLSRGIDATEGRDSPRLPPSTLTPHPHNPRVSIPVKFDRENLESWINYYIAFREEGRESNIVSPPGAKDRGKQWTIRTHYFSATISETTLIGTVTVLVEDGYKTQMRRLMGDSVGEQVDNALLKCEWEDSFNKSFLRSIKKAGKKIGLELPNGSHEPGGQVEYHGFSPKQMQYIEGKVVVNDVEQRVTLGLLLDRLESIEGDLNGLRGAVNIQTSAIGQQTAASIRIADNITKQGTAIQSLAERLGELLGAKPGSQPAAPGKAQEPASADKPPRPGMYG